MPWKANKQYLFRFITIAQQDIWIYDILLQLLLKKGYPYKLLIPPSLADLSWASMWAHIVKVEKWLLMKSCEKRIAYDICFSWVTSNFTTAELKHPAIWLWLWPVWDNLRCTVWGKLQLIWFLIWNCTTVSVLHLYPWPLQNHMLYCICF